MSGTAPQPRSEQASSLATDSAEKESNRKQTPRKNVTVACKLCRERRTRCDGQQPCSRCLRIGSGCTYAQDPDGRSQLAIKRKYENIQDESDFLSELLAGIRMGSDDQINRIIGLIRTEAPVKQIRDAVQQGLVGRASIGREPDPDVNTAVPIAQRQNGQPGATTLTGREEVLRIHRLTASPLYQVPATPWIRVTADSDLVSELISAWAAWDCPWMNIISIRHFIRDMQSGDPNSIYCSSFLVNCVLAWACPYSDWPEARTNNGVTSTLMKEFVTEAENMLKAELDKGPTLTTVQGCAILAMTEMVNGRAYLGYRYLVASMDMCEDLSRSERFKKPMENDHNREEYLQVLGIMCWGLYNVTASSFLVFMNPHGMKRPHFPKPVIPTEDGHEHMWVPYPQSTQPIPSYVQELMDFRCDVAMDESFLSHLMYDLDIKDNLGREKHEEEIIMLLRRISQKLDSIRVRLNVQEDLSIGVLGHIMWSLSVKIRTFLFLRQSYDDTSQLILQFAEKDCLEAALEIAQLCGLRTKSYGNAPVPIVFIEPVIMAICAFLELPDVPGMKEELTELCNCLYSITKRWPKSILGLSHFTWKADIYGQKTPQFIEAFFDRLENGERRVDINS